MKKNNSKPTQGKICAKDRKKAYQQSLLLSNPPADPIDWWYEYYFDQYVYCGTVPGSHRTWFFARLSALQSLAEDHEIIVSPDDAKLQVTIYE